MSYCTLADLVARYGEQELRQRTDPQGLGVIDEATVAKAIGLTDAEIDGALMDAGYTPPIVWARLQGVAEARTRGYLYPQGMPQEVADDFKDARRVLDQISEGKLRPPGVTAGDPPAVGGPSFAAGTDLWDPAAIAQFMDQP